MNVLFLSELFFPHAGGAELATYLYSKILEKANFNLTLVTNRFPGEEKFSKKGNLTIYRLPLLKVNQSIKYSLMRNSDKLFSGLLRRLLKWSDIVYIPGSWYFAIPIAKTYGKRVVTHLHDYLAICPQASLYDLSEDTVCSHSNQILCSPKCIVAYEKNRNSNSKRILLSTFLNSCVGNNISKLVALSDSIICVSEMQKQIIEKNMPSIADKLHVIYNPFPDVPQFTGQNGDFGYFGGSPVLKGFSILLRALNKLQIKHNIHATNMSDISDTVAEGLQNQFGIIIHKRLERQSFNCLYQSIQVVLVPSIWPEPLPYVVSEALLSRRLVIASRIGGIPELAKDCKGAYLYNPGDYEQLAELIEFVDGLDSETKLTLGAENRQSFLRNHKNGKTSRDFIKVITQS